MYFASAGQTFGVFIMRTLFSFSLLIFSIHTVQATAPRAAGCVDAKPRRFDRGAYAACNSTPEQDAQAAAELAAQGFRSVKNAFRFKGLQTQPQSGQLSF